MPIISTTYMLIANILLIISRVNLLMLTILFYYLNKEFFLIKKSSSENKNSSADRHNFLIRTDEKLPGITDYITCHAYYPVSFVLFISIKICFN